MEQEASYPRGDRADRLALEQAFADWDFSGLNGSYRAVVKDLAWIHIAFPVSPALGKNDVGFNITWDYGISENLPQASFHYYGVEMAGRDGGEPPVQSGRAIYQGNTTNLRVSTSVAGQSESFAVPGVLPGFPPESRYDDNPVLHWDSVGLYPSYEDLSADFGHDRPVWNAFQMLAGGSQARPAVMNLWWNNTILNLTYGTSEDVFLYSLDDFHTETSTAVSAHPVHFRAGKEYALEYDHQNGSSLAFTFLGITNIGGLASMPAVSEDAWYQRPDGSREVMADGVPEALEFSAQAGSWNFGIPENSMTTNGDLPALWGVRFDRALVAPE